MSQQRGRDQFNPSPGPRCGHEPVGRILMPCYLDADPQISQEKFDERFETLTDALVRAVGPSFNVID
jgi:hypothetical protein